MPSLTIAYPDTGRKLSYFITKCLRSGVCSQLRRLNYCQHYVLDQASADRKGKPFITKTQEKILMLWYAEADQAKLEAFLAQELGQGWHDSLVSL